MAAVADPRDCDVATGFALARQLRDPAFRNRIRAAGYRSGVPVHTVAPGTDIAALTRRLDADGPGPHLVALRTETGGWWFLRFTINGRFEID